MLLPILPSAHPLPQSSAQILVPPHSVHISMGTHLPLFSLFKSVPKIVLSPILPSAHPLPKSCAQILHAPHTRNTFSIVRYEISVPGLSHPFPYPPYYKIVHHPSFCLAHFFLFLYKTMFLGSCTPSYTHRTTAKCTIPVSVLSCRWLFQFITNCHTSLLFRPLTIHASQIWILPKWSELFLFYPL